MTTPNASITDLDFASIKNSLKNYLKSQTQFKDYNFEGSNLNALLDVLAFNSYQNNFYTNMAINEMFLDTAVLKNSIVSHAKELNYLPRSRKSAKAVINVNVFSETLNTETYTIPQYSVFSSTYLGQNFTFITDKSYIARRIAANTYQADNVEIFEGQILTSFQREGFIVDDDGNLRVYLSNDNADIDTLEVFVNAEATDDLNVFTYAKDIFGVEADSKVFYVEPYFDNRYSVYFGNDIYGVQPKEFEDVRVKYRITSGEEANGASAFTATFLENGTITCTTVTAAAGGAERESLESIRFNAPKSLQIQERAITSTDYEILLKQKFPTIKAVAAYSGDQLDPPQFGKVAVSVFLNDSTQLISSTLANSYIEYLQGRSPIGIEPIFVQTKYVYADLEIQAYYTNKFLDKSTDELETLIRAQVQSYSDLYLEDFNKTFRASNLSTQIDSIDTAILSNDIIAMPIIEYAPILNIAANPVFKFEAELIKPYPFDEEAGFRDYKPAIQSNEFDINGACVYIQDDGLGNIQIITSDITNPQIVRKDAGTVNYETGEVKLIKFVVESYTGTGIKIKARVKSSDIEAPQGRVFILRDQDVKVTLNLSDKTGTKTSAGS